MMLINANSFLDELVKIAEVQQQAFVTKDRVLRALKSGLAASGGMGLGWGLGNLAANTILPSTLQRFVPNPTASQLQKGMLIAGGLGTMGSLALDYAKNRASQYIEEVDRKPEDRLMGHEKLNPATHAQPGDLGHATPEEEALVWRGLGQALREGKVPEGHHLVGFVPHAQQANNSDSREPEYVPVKDER